MKTFKGHISLIRNSRGCYILDTVKGCAIVNEKPRGCYDDCYAKSIADRYNFDFSRPVARRFFQDTRQPSLFGFDDADHMNEVIRAIRKIKMPFVRIGEMGDPSEDWEHTLDVAEKIAPAGKAIVIITKHWKPIPDALLPKIRRLCINTSVSALDEPEEIEHRLGQYERLKLACFSVLRIVSCDFNRDNEEGKKRALVQEQLFKNDRTLDTVFRPSKDNPFLARGVIKASMVDFLRRPVLASMHNLQTYFGKCHTCQQMCGVNV